MVVDVTELKVEELSKYFGGVCAVNGATFDIRTREIFGIIGPNGAGKSTLFNVITGVLQPTSGRVFFRGEEITHESTPDIARRGLVRTFQATTLFRRISVAENLRRGYLFGHLRRPSALLTRATTRSARAGAARKVEQTLSFLGMTRYADAIAGDLPYGSQKIIGVGMAITAGPQLMLMDEPAAGLNPVETNAMAKLIVRLRDELNIGIGLVEHDMKMVMSICDRILVLNHGVPVRTGTPTEIQTDPAVIESYLGTDDELA